MAQSKRKVKDSTPVGPATPKSSSRATRSGPSPTAPVASRSQKRSRLLSNDDDEDEDEGEPEVKEEEDDSEEVASLTTPGGKKRKSRGATRKSAKRPRTEEGKAADEAVSDDRTSATLDAGEIVGGPVADEGPGSKEEEEIVPVLSKEERRALKGKGKGKAKETEEDVPPAQDKALLDENSRMEKELGFKNSVSWDSFAHGPPPFVNLLKCAFPRFFDAKRTSSLL